MRYTFWIVVFALTVVQVRPSETEGVSSTVASKSLQVRAEKRYVIMPGDYKTTEPPIPEDGVLVISVEMQIWSITEISAQSMDMEVDLYLTLSWFDFRLEFDTRNVSGDNDWIPIGRNASSNLWKPQITFLNCKGCDIINLTSGKNKVFFQRDKKIIRVSARTLQKFTCNIDLHSYPMDQQLCRIQLMNYYEDTTDITFHQVFDEKHMMTNSRANLAEFVISRIGHGNCSIEIDGDENACVELKVYLKRLIGHHIMVLYSPSIFIVMLSWLSFWLHVDATPARITLGVTSLLTLSTQFAQAQKGLPPVSYIKAIDVWMFMCIFQVFASLVEFAISNFWWRASKLGSAVEAVKIQVRPYGVKRELVSGPVNQNQSVTKIDKLSRIFFPLMFLFFNLVYWCGYL